MLNMRIRKINFGFGRARRSDLVSTMSSEVETVGSGGSIDEEIADSGVAIDPVSGLLTFDSSFNLVPGTKEIPITVTTDYGSDSSVITVEIAEKKVVNPSFGSIASNVASDCVFAYATSSGYANAVISMDYTVEASPPCGSWTLKNRYFTIEYYTVLKDSENPLASDNKTISSSFAEMSTYLQLTSSISNVIDNTDKSIVTIHTVRSTYQRNGSTAETALTNGGRLANCYHRPTLLYSVGDKTISTTLSIPCYSGYLNMANKSSNKTWRAQHGRILRFGPKSFDSWEALNRWPEMQFTAHY